MPPVLLSADAAVSGETIHLRTLGCNILIRCLAAPEVRRALDTAFGGMRAPPTQGRVDLEYTIRQAGATILLETDTTQTPAGDIGDLVYQLDKSLTLALQRIRHDLCFIHGGALVAPDGRVIVLTAASGSGKSTLTWALLHHGFGYLSDELAPVEPVALEIEGYPHALCLKSRPPEPYSLPAETLVTSDALHIPVAQSAIQGRLAAIFFVSHRYPDNHPVLCEITPARSAIWLYGNTLNPLSHPNDGLDAVAAIVQEVPGYELNSRNLDAACHAIQALLDVRRR